MEEQIIRKADLNTQRKWDVDHLKELSERADLLEKVSPEFKVIVSDLRDFLEQTKRDLDAEELKFRYEESRMQVIDDSELIHIAERIVTGYINKAVAGMNQLVAPFTPAEHTVHRNYFQRHLHPLLLLSPFVSRAYQKPLGCPGDYQMMNMIYGDHDQGESLFACLLNRYSCRVMAARAVAGRVPYLVGKIGRTIDRVLKKKEEVPIASIGAGPAKEIQELMKSNSKGDQCHVSLVDMVPEALTYCREKMFNLRLATGSRMRIDFLNRSVRDLIRSPHALDSLAGQELLYTIGLFDYLPFHVARHVVQKLYGLLSEGGELIVGNFDVSNDSRYYMEYAAEWFLLYRTREEMLDLACGLPAGAEASIESDEEGAQLYLIIKKSRETKELRSSQKSVAAVSYGKP